MSSWLWEVLQDRQRDGRERLRAAGALAAYAPEDSRWDPVCIYVVQ
jgi:hypothetical protein